MERLSFLSSASGRADRDREAARFPLLGELLDEILAMEGAACALCEGCLAVRLEVDAGEYAFFAPIPYREGADVTAALGALEAYAVREEIPLVFTDLSEEECTALAARYPHARSYALPTEGRYLLYVLTEAELLTELPTLYGETVTLSAPRTADAALYGALCRDSEHLRYFGYDDLRECPDATDRELVERRLAEWERRCALPFFIYHNGVFVGELVLFAFDGRGTAELSVRLLRHATGQGLASDAVRTAIAFAEDTLDLVRITARCHRDNLPSGRLLTRRLGTPTADGEQLLFGLSLMPKDARK